MASLFRKIKRGEYVFDPQYWDSISDEAKDLIRHVRAAMSEGPVKVLHD